MNKMLIIIKMDIYLGLIPAFSIGLGRWSYSLLVVGAWPTRLKFSYTQRFALLLYMLSSLLSWINYLAVLKKQGFAIQLMCSLAKSVFDWMAFVIIYNGCFAFKRDQLNAIVFSIINSMLYDIQCRVMLGK